MSRDYDPAFDASEPPEVLEITYDGDDAAKWGLSDFYEDIEPRVKDVWEDKDQNFKFSWGCKKEIHYCEAERVDGTTTIEARAYIDELYDLVDTALWRAYGGSGKCSGGYDAVAKIHGLDPRKDEGKIHELMEECQGFAEETYEECHFGSAELDANATWDDFIRAIDEAETKAEKAAEANYQSVIEVMKWVIEEQWGVDLEEEKSDD
jgi:hypothetical protein